MVKHPLYCYACNDSHELTVGDRERLIYVLQAGELTAALQLDDALIREPDTYDCLLTWLELSHDLEGYAEHVEQAVLCRRDKAGARPGDEDLCVCGERIRYVELVGAGAGGAPKPSILRWEHEDALSWGKCRYPKPDPGRQP
jgi:hypothetical protein